MGYEGLLASPWFTWGSRVLGDACLNADIQLYHQKERRNSRKFARIAPILYVVLLGKVFAFLIASEDRQMGQRRIIVILLSTSLPVIINRIKGLCNCVTLWAQYYWLIITQRSLVLSICRGVLIRGWGPKRLFLKLVRRIRPPVDPAFFSMAQGLFYIYGYVEMGTSLSRMSLLGGEALFLAGLFFLKNLFWCWNHSSPTFPVFLGSGHIQEGDNLLAKQADHNRSIGLKDMIPIAHYFHLPPPFPQFLTLLGQI